MTFTLKTLEKHSKVVTTLLDGTDCDYVFTGSVAEQDGVETHGWFVSRPANDGEIGVEVSNKRTAYLAHLTRASQLQYAKECDVA